MLFSRKSSSVKRKFPEDQEDNPKFRFIRSIMVFAVGGSPPHYSLRASRDTEESKDDTATSQNNSSSQTGSPLARILKSSAKFVSDQMRPDDENTLFRLTGDNQIRNALNQFMPELCDAIALLFPNYIAKVGGNDKTTITRIAENLVLHVLANFGKVLFGSPPSKLITKEAFFGKLGYFLIKLFWEHISAIDTDIQNGIPLEKDAFKPLASKLLEIALPKEQEGFFSQLFVFGEKKLATSYTLEPLSNFFNFLYRKFILREKESSTTMSTSQVADFADKKEDLKELIDLSKKGIAFLIKAFSNHVIFKENRFFEKKVNTEEISKIIKSLLSPLIVHLSKMIPKSYQELLPQDPEAIADLVTSLIMTVLGSIGRGYVSSNPEKEIELVELFENITSTIFNNIHKNYEEVLAFLKKKERVKAKYFFTFIQEILKTLMPEHDKFFQIVIYRFPEIQEMIAAIAMDFVLAIDNNSTKLYTKELRTLLWNKKEILAMHPTLSQLPDIPKKALSEALGNEKLVENIANFCSELGNQSLVQIEKFIGDENALFNLLIEAFPELEDCGDLPDALQGISNALLSRQASTEAFLLYLKKLVGTIIFKGCVIFFKNSSSNRKLDTLKLLPSALKKGIGVLGRQFSNIQQNLDCYNEDDDDEPCHRFFIPLIEELTHLLFHDRKLNHEFKDILPIPKWIQPQIAKLLTHHALPMLLHKCYSEVTVWQKQKKENKKNLATLFGNKRANEVCRILAHFIPEFLAYYFRTSAKELAGILLEQCQKYLINNSAKDLKQFENIIISAIKFIGVKNKYFSKLWEFTIKFSECAFLKVFANFFNKIEAMEKLYSNDPGKSFEGGLNIQITLKFIEDATKHFQTVNSIKKDIGEKRASRVPASAMLNGFKATHPFIKSICSTDPDFQNLFENFALKGLTFLELEDEDLPLPKIGQDTIWNLFKTKLFPKVLSALFTKLTSLPTIHQIVLSSLKRTNEAIDNLENKKLRNGNGFKVPDDHLQRELAQMCGDLIGTLVDLHPSALPKQFLERRNIRIKVGEAIAHSVRENIESISTLDLCDKIFESSLSSVHPGTWVRRKNQAVNTKKSEIKDRFIPHKKDAYGKVTKGFAFPFPKTKQEQKAFKVKNQKEEQNVAAEVVSELSGMISKQTKLTLNAGLRGMWENFQSLFDDVIEKNFQGFGLQVKHSLDRILHTAFSMFIYPILRIALFPFIKLSSLFLNCYLKNQSKWRAGDLGIDVNKYLFLKTFNSFFNILEERNQILVKS